MKGRKRDTMFGLVQHDDRGIARSVWSVSTMRHRQDKDITDAPFFPFTSLRFVTTSKASWRMRMYGPRISTISRPVSLLHYVSEGAKD